LRVTDDNRETKETLTADPTVLPGFWEGSLEKEAFGAAKFCDV